jgi:hypothetical protein
MNYRKYVRQYLPSSQKNMFKEARVFKLRVCRYEKPHPRYRLPTEFLPIVVCMNDGYDLRQCL